jgi:hypothetical protein
LSAANSRYYPLTGGLLNGSLTASNGSFNNIFVAEQDAGPAVLYAISNKVGVNTESPNEALTVVGNVSSTGTMYSNYVQLSNVRFTNEYSTNVNSITATNDFLKVVVGNTIKYLRLYDIE